MRAKQRIKHISSLVLIPSHQRSLRPNNPRRQIIHPLFTERRETSRAIANVYQLLATSEERHLATEEDGSVATSARFLTVALKGSAKYEVSIIPIATSYVKLGGSAPALHVWR